MSVFEHLTREAERKTGLKIWDGKDGLGAVCSETLNALGVPLEISITPRSIVEALSEKRPRARRVIGG